MVKGLFAVMLGLTLLLTTGRDAAAQKPAPTPILSGPLAKLDIKDAQVATVRGKPRGTLTIGMHFGLDPGWLDPLEHQASVNPDERERLVKAIQRILIEESYLVPIYLNPFVHAVGPRVLPAGEGFHRYWDAPQAGYPYPWEVWGVKADK
jgi:hypothetical protein